MKHAVKDKEDLLSQAYIFVNEQIAALAAKAIREVKDSPLTDSDVRFAAVIHRIWDSLIKCSDVCVFCNYYYHSASFKKYAGDQHHALVARLLEALREEYIVHEQAEAALYYLMESIIGFASKVIDGFYPNTEEYFDLAIERLYPIFRSVASPK